MTRAFSVELSRRSLFFAAGRVEFMGEWRGSEWPKQWSYLAEPSSRELWLGRLYVCIARVRTSAPGALPLPATGAEDASARECRILAFKAPVRAI